MNIALADTHNIKGEHYFGCIDKEDYKIG